MKKTLTQREKERLQAQLDAIHSRIPAEEAAKLLEIRKSLPPGPAGERGPCLGWRGGSNDRRAGARGDVVRKGPP